MRNAMVLSVENDCPYPVLRNFKLFRNFGDAHAVGEIIDNRAGRHPGANQNGITAQYAWFDFNEWAIIDRKSTRLNSSHG